MAWPVNPRGITHKASGLQGLDFCTAQKLEHCWQLTLSPMQVMGVNGVSHHIVEDDLAGCMAALQWLAYVPAVLGSLPPALPTTDPISRPIGYCPGPSECPDPGLQTNGQRLVLVHNMYNTLTCQH